MPRHGVKALAAGAVLIAAALPLAVASTAGAAATSLTSVTIATNAASGGNGTQTSEDYFGTGASGEFTLNGTFVNDGGNITVTSNAPGVTFSGATETGGGGTTATAYFSSTSATVPGTYSVTVTDDGGTSTLAGAFSVNSAPTVSSLSKTTLADSATPTATSVTITGSGFENATFEGTTVPSVTLTSETNGTTLTVGTATVGGTVTNNVGTTLTLNVTPTNSVNGHAATPGVYDLTVTNTDGGTTTDVGALTITAAPITNLDPSAFPHITTGTQTDSFVVNGSGFEIGAAVTFSGTCNDASGTPSTTFNSATSLTVTFTQVPNATNEDCSVLVTNPSTTQGGNGDTALLTNGLGFGEASAIAPTITATSDTTAIVPGSPSGTITFTGTGFSQYNTASAYLGTSTTAATGVTLANASGNSGTSITFTLSVASAQTTIAGSDGVVVSGSNEFPAAILVAGPVISSQSPTDIPVGAPVGTVVTLTGTGFTPTLSGTVTANSVTGLAGNVDYVNATTLDVIVTSSPSTAGSSTNPATVTGYESLVGGTGTAGFAAFDLSVGAGPTVTGITYAAGTTGVGVGATAQPITITGTNFKTGVVVGGFKNANGVADPDVTAKVVSINATGTSAVVDIAIVAGDTNIADGFTVTNTDTGVATVSATSGFPLVIQAAPTITTLTPATAPANSTTAFTIAGTGFGSGATVAATADGTCGSATVVSSTSITVSCTFGAATSTAAALQVTNLNGGSATSATVLAAGSAPAPAAPHATGEAGSAIVGRTVSIAVAGVGFYGQPTVTSTGASVKAVVSKDTGTLLTVQVTVGTTTGPGEHTLTFTLANGKVFKVNYLIIK